MKLIKLIQGVTVAIQVTRKSLCNNIYIVYIIAILSALYKCLFLMLSEIKADTDDVSAVDIHFHWMRSE